MENNSWKYCTQHTEEFKSSNSAVFVVYILYMVAYQYVSDFM